MLAFGTRDTVTAFALTPPMLRQLRRDMRPYAAGGAVALLVVAVGIAVLVLPVWPALHVFSWGSFVMAGLGLAQAGSGFVNTLTDVRGGGYVRRTGAATTDFTTTQGKNGGTRRFWLHLMGLRFALTREAYLALQGVAYVAMEHTRSGTVLRVRDFAGHTLYQRWADCAFPLQEEDMPALAPDRSAAALLIQ